MRACQPNRDGFVERDGVKIYYEVFGAGQPTVLLLPTWSVVHSRHWKMQIPYLARHCRVVTFDGRGNGQSDRPTEPEAYREEEFAADALAVMDATGTERAVLVVALSGGGADAAPGGETSGAGRKVVFIAPALPLPPATPRLKAIQEFGERHDAYPAGRNGTATTGSTTTRTSSSSSSRSSSPSHTRPSRGRTASAGGWRRNPRR